MFFLCLSRANAQQTLSADTIMKQAVADYARSTTMEKRFEHLLNGLAVQEEVTDDFQLASFYFLLADALWQLGLKEEALHYIQRSIERSRLAPETPRILYLRVGSAVTYFLNMQMPDSALVLAQEANSVMRSRDSIYRASSLNNVGMCYLGMNELALARASFDSALMVMPRLGELEIQKRLLVVAIHDNLAQVHAAENDWDGAIDQVGKNIQSLKTIPPADDFWFGKMLEYGLRKAEYEIKAERWQDAIITMMELREFFDECPENLSEEGELKMLKTELQVSGYLKDVVRQVELSATILARTEKLNNEVSDAQRSSIQRLSALSLDKAQHEFRQDLLIKDQKVHFRNYLLLLLFFILILVLASGYLLYKSRIQQKQLENQRLETELRQKNNDISNLALDISRRKQVTEEVLKYLQELKDSKSQQFESVDLSSVERDLRRRIKADEKREWIHKEVEDVNTAFYERLRARFPDLVPTELELCAMVRSGMSNKQIAEIRNISPGSARTARYRLGKKLGAEEGMGLVELLNQI